MTARSFTVIDSPQRSPEWHAARLGRLTGSRAADMLSTVKSGEAAGRRNLRTQLVLERITGRVQETGFTSAAMQQGIDRENDALWGYAAQTGQYLETTGFTQHNTLMTGCSLDGHIGDYEGLVEIKCPLPATHLEYLTSSQVPAKYVAQITHNMWVTGAPWCDFVSYNPDFPDKLRLKIVRVRANPLLMEQYEIKLMVFLSEVTTEYNTVLELLEAA